jgi:hypothetical protein
MDDETRMPREPGFDPWMFVGGVVVRDQMDFEVGRHVAVEVIKEREKLLMAMARLALGDDRPQNFTLPGVAHDAEVFASGRWSVTRGTIDRGIVRGCLRQCDGIIRGRSIDSPRGLSFYWYLADGLFHVLQEQQ